MLLSIYEIEILRWWSYMAFDGQVTTPRFILCLMASIFLAAILPTRISSRAFLFTIIHYAYTIPSIIIIATNESTENYAITFIVTYALLFAFSLLKLRAIRTFEITNQLLITSVVTIIVLTILTLVIFGGTTHFNLNLERVYEFRRTADAELPSLARYLYSNISTVIIPIGLMVSVIFRKWTLAIFIIIASIAIFGMTHHKTVFFTPFITLSLYLLFKKTKNPSQLGWLFVLIAASSLLELYFLKYIFKVDIPGIFTSYSIRRTLLTPAIIDKIYVDFFIENFKYFWSTSKISLGLIEDPWGASAPFLVGLSIFGDEDMSANAGMLGSGFANAGLGGAALYAFFTGLLIALLNSYGRILGHAFVTSISVMAMMFIINSTDVVTAVLSHGLLILLFFISIIPRHIILK